jgi:hypothetical protein
MKKFLTLFLLNSKVFAQTTGIVGLDDQISTGTRILQVFLFLVGIGCISYAAWLFGSGKAKQQGLEILFGILVIAGLAVGGIAWWTGKTSGFLI